MTDARDIVEEAIENIEAAWMHDRQNREEARADLRFLAGQHWTDEELAARKGRPTLTINKLPTFVRQVANDIRQNAPSIKVVGVDEAADKETARILSGLIRSIEMRSGAEHIYSAAAYHVAACGIGHFRFKTEYVDDAVFEQDIVISRIRDPLAVYWDPASVKPDRSDAMWCAVLEQIPRATFEERYPDAKIDSLAAPDSAANSSLVWLTHDDVVVAEYIKRFPIKRRLAQTIDGKTIDVTDLPQASMAVLPIVKMRDVDTYQVKSWMVSASEVLSGPHDWAGKWIPVVTIVGEEIPVGDVVMRSGVTRSARDPQRIYNYQWSAATEVIGQAPKSPWLVTQKMIAKFRAWWDRANVDPQPYLPYEPDDKAPGLAPRREAPPAPPTAMWDAMRVASDDIKAVTGIFDASLGARGNETSGRAITARQREGDVANYHITDNLAESMAHAGRILVDLIPKIYDTERMVRILGEDDAEEFVTINQEQPDGLGGVVRLNDVSMGRFDVRVISGPGYATRRQEAADSMLQFAQAVPMAAEAFPDLIAKNLDWPGAEEIAERLKKLLEMRMPGITAEDAGAEGSGSIGSAGTAGMEAQQNQGLPEVPAPQPMAPDQIQQQQAAASDAQMAQLKIEEQQLRNEKLRAEIEVVRMKLTAPLSPMQPDSSPNGETFNGFQ